MDLGLRRRQTYDIHSKSRNYIFEIWSWLQPEKTIHEGDSRYAILIWLWGYQTFLEKAI